jgi:DNA-binding MarR family transcriptional regulator
MRTVTGEAAAKHGLTMRDHIVLSALHLSPGMTQVELGKALGMDKTTLTSELDRLEGLGLVKRSIDARDRRARTLAVTAPGERVRRRVSAEAERAERATLSAVSESDVARLRRMLYDLIGNAEDPGTCL